MTLIKRSTLVFLLLSVCGLAQGAAIEFTATTFSTNEITTPATITLKRTGVTTAAASVRVSVTGGTATATSDYTFTATTVSWAANDAADKTVSVVIVDDRLVEGTETVIFGLSAVTGDTIGTDSATTLSILDYEQGTVQFTSATFEVLENAGNATITLSRTNGSDGPASVLMSSANGTATAASDYLAVAITVSWADGDTANKTVNVPLIDDRLVEGTETVALSLSAVTNAIIGTVSTATLSILDHEQGTVQFSSATFSVLENAGNASITLTRVDGSNGPATVLVSSANGTATASSDYTPIATTVSWADGDAAIKTINLPIIDDRFKEDTETVTLSLSAVTNAIIGTVSTATLSILDYEQGTVQFSSATFTVAENAGNASITVNRVGGSDGAATVLVSSANGTALAQSDYTSVATTVSWADGDVAVKTVTVPIIDDRLVEGTESLTLSLSAVTNATLGAVSTTTLNITDYEQGTLEFSSATFSVDERAGTAFITVSRTNGKDGAVTVNYATVNGSATSPGFFTAATGTLTFAEGIFTQTIPIAIIDNTLGQVNKSFTINLSAVTGGALLGTRTSTTVTIINDDVDFTLGLTRITPVVTNVTQGEVISLSQNSPFNAANTLLATINRIPELAITSLFATQSETTGIMEIPVGDTVFHLLPYSAVKANTNSSAIFLNPDQSGRMITDEGFQINFQPAMANTAVLQTTLISMSLPKMTITRHGNLTVQSNQGPPPLDLDSSGKLVINNSFYNRYNLRPSITSSLAPAGAVQGVYLLPHPNAALPNEVYMQVVYSQGTTLRQQLLTTAPAIGSELIDSLVALSGKNIRFEAFGVVSLLFNNQPLRIYADIIVRRVDPSSYSGGSPATGLTYVGDLNRDGTTDLKMIYSNGDEQYFYILP